MAPTPEPDDDVNNSPVDAAGAASTTPETEPPAAPRRRRRSPSKELVAGPLAGRTLVANHSWRAMQASVAGSPSVTATLAQITESLKITESFKASLANVNAGVAGQSAALTAQSPLIQKPMTTELEKLTGALPSKSLVGSPLTSELARFKAFSAELARVPIPRIDTTSALFARLELSVPLGSALSEMQNSQLNAQALGVTGASELLRLTRVDLDPLRSLRSSPLTDFFRRLDERTDESVDEPMEDAGPSWTLTTEAHLATEEARAAAIQGETDKVIEFAERWLGLSPSRWSRRQALALDQALMDLESADLNVDLAWATLQKVKLETKRNIRSRAMLGDQQARHQPVGSLDAMIETSSSDWVFGLVAETAAPADSRLMRRWVTIRDPRMVMIFSQLTLSEARIVLAKGADGGRKGVSWQEAAETCGAPRREGERVRAKVDRARALVENADQQRLGRTVGGQR